MEFKSYFKGNLNKPGEHILEIYPLSTKLLLKIIDNTAINIDNLYIEKGETTVENPCEVFTEKNFSKQLIASELANFLENDKELFVMQFEFSLINSRTCFVIDDDIETTIRNFSDDFILSFLFKLFKEFEFNNTNEIFLLIKENTNKYICLNENGTLWKIIDNEKLFMSDEEVLKYY